MSERESPEEFEELVHYIMAEIDSGKSQYEIRQSLIDRGLPSEFVSDLIDQTLNLKAEQHERTLQGEKYRKMMWRGCAFLVFVSLATGCAYFMIKPRGLYVLFSGAALTVGAIYFIVGLIGAFMRS